MAASTTSSDDEEDVKGILEIAKVRLLPTALPPPLPHHPHH